MPKISQLPTLLAITSGSIIPVVENSTTQKITVGKLYEFLSGTLDQTFTTEIELMRSASAITSSINTLSASFDQRINSVIVGEANIPNGTISSSNQITQLGYAKTGSNTFNGSQTISEGNSLLVNRIENTTGGNIEIAATGLLSLSGDGGGVTTNDNFEANPGGNATFKVTSGSVSITGSISATGTTLISSSTQITSLGFISGSYVESSSYSTVSDSTKTIGVIASSYDIQAYPVFVNTINGVPIILQGDNNLRYNANTNKLSVGSISATQYLDGQLLSSSQQISDYGFLSTSSFNTFTQSIDGRVADLESWSSSLDTTFATDLEVSVVSGAIATTTGILQNSFTTTSSFNSYTTSINNVTSSLVSKTGSYATTGSNTFSGSQTITGSILISGSLIPNVGAGTSTSSFSLGSPTNAWKDIYLSHGSIVFVDSVTQATSSFTIQANKEVKYSNGITASYYEGDGSRLYNLPATTNWNKDKEYILRKTEQLTFSGDYILENSFLVIEGSATASVDGIDEWVPVIFTDGNGGTITKNTNNGYLITGPTGDTNGSDGVQIKRLFDTNTTMSISYVWSGDGTASDRPYYEISAQDPTEPDNSTNLSDPYATSEIGTWTLNVPSGSWVAIGVWTDNVNATSGSLQLTFPYTDTADIEQYSTNKYFKREGSIFIGGNLLLKDSQIENNGHISVGGEVILIGNSQITGTGTII